MMPVNNLDSPAPRCDSDASRLSGSNEIYKKIPNFKIMSPNIFSLFPHLDELLMLVDNDKPHIICINQTKLDDSTDDSLIHINDYVIIRKDRNKHGGGVAIYIHQNIQFELKSE